jgi:hypothetical protein
MEKTFRAILLEHLETENEPSYQAPPAPSHPAADEFNFTAVEFNRPRSRAKSFASGYSSASTAKTAETSSENGKIRLASPASAPAAAPPEPTIELARLNTADRLLVDRLIEYGADELKNGLSLKKLKKAHRRLAKIWHPDARPMSALGAQQALKTKNAAEAASVFMEIQTAYKDLEAALSRSLSESADGNESASAAGSQRRAAA